MNERLLDGTAFMGSLPGLLGEGLANTVLIAAQATLTGLLTGIATTALLRSGRWWLFFIAQQESARTNSSAPLVAAGACHLAITAPLTFLAGRVMRRHGRLGGRPPTALPIQTSAGAFR